MYMYMYMLCIWSTAVPLLPVPSRSHGGRHAQKLLLVCPALWTALCTASDIRAGRSHRRP